MNVPTKAMVLAAGFGTRMRELTRDCPKPLLEVTGRSLIDRTLDRLVEAGIRDAVVNLHYLPDMVREHLEKRDDIRIAFSDESDEILETGGGISKALPILGDTPFYVVNSDNIWLGKNAFDPLWECWNPAKMDALLLLTPIEGAVGYTRAGDFALDDDWRLVRRGDQPSAPFVFTGVQILHPRLFEGAPEGAFSLNILWDKAIAEGRAYGVVHTEGWCDVGTPEGLDDAAKALLR